MLSKSLIFLMVVKESWLTFCGMRKGFWLMSKLISWNQEVMNRYYLGDLEGLNGDSFR